MKKTFLWLIVLSGIIMFPFFCSCDELIVKDWSAYSGVNDLKIKEDGLLFNSAGQFPLLASRNDLFINANKFSILKVKMRADKSYLTGRLFFRRVGDRDFNIANSYELQTGLNNGFHDYVIDLSRNPNWYGVVMQLMFSPGNSEGPYEIAGFKVMEPGPPLKIAAIGQEFFTFEVPQLRTLNFIYGPKISGISVNVYIYYSILLLSLLVLAWELISHKEFIKAFNISSKYILVICLAFWMALDMRILFDQTRSVIFDIQTFGFKGLEEKRALSTPGDLYSYLTFVRSKLSERSGIDMLFTSSNYFREKALYYLYPMHYDESSDYVLVYDPYKSLDKELRAYMQKGYKMFAFFKEGELILKK